MTARERFIAIIVAVVALFGISALIWGPKLMDFYFPKIETKKDTKGYIKAKPVQLVEFPRTIKSIGTLTASNQVTIKTETRGRVAKIHFNDGQDIKKGEPIIEFDTKVLELEFKQRQAKADQLKQVYLRNKELKTKNLVSDNDFEESRANYMQAQAAADERKVMLEKAVIKAPFDGRLGIREKEVSVGAFITEGNNIVTLVSTNPMFVDFRVAAHNSDNIAPGQKIEFIIDGPSETTRFKGEVMAVDSKVETTGNTLLVRGKVSSPSAKIKAGQFVQVFVTTHVDKDVIMVPVSSVYKMQNQDVVYIYYFDQEIKYNTVRPTSVITGQTKDGMIEIKKGLLKDSVVVYERPKNVTPGQRIDNWHKPSK